MLHCTVKQHLLLAAIPHAEHLVTLQHLATRQCRVKLIVLCGYAVKVPPAVLMVHVLPCCSVQSTGLAYSKSTLYFAPEPYLSRIEALQPKPGDFNAQVGTCAG